MSPTSKLCPRCQTPAPLDARFCSQCGHQYRTQFPSTSPSPLPDPDAPLPFQPWKGESKWRANAAMICGGIGFLVLGYLTLQMPPQGDFDRFQNNVILLFLLWLFFWGFSKHFPIR